MISKDIENTALQMLDLAEGGQLDWPAAQRLAQDLAAIKRRVEALEGTAVPRQARYSGAEAEGVVDLTKRRRPQPRLAKSGGPDGGSAA